jgi:hypothetical protein
MTDRYLQNLLLKVDELNRPPLTRGSFDLKGTSLSFVFVPEDKNGYNIKLSANENGYQLACEGWHEEFLPAKEQSDDEFAQQLYEQLVTLLNGQTILRITKAGRWPYKWEILYEYEPGKTESLGASGLIFFNYFGKRGTENKKNTVLVGITI